MSNQKLKLLILGIKWHPEIFIYNRLKGLEAKDVDISVAARGDFKENKIFFEEKIRIIPLSPGRHPFFLRMIALGFRLFIKSLKIPFRVLAFYKATVNITPAKERIYFFLYRILPLIKEAPDIIHFQWNSASIQYLSFYELFNAKILISCCGSHVNIIVHNPDKPYITIDLLKESFKKADAIHCISEAMKTEVLKYTDEENKIHVIRPAVNTSLFAPAARKIQNRGIKIVSIGRVSWKKGYVYALTAIRDLVNKGLDVTYTIVAEEDEENEKRRILHAISDLGIQEHVKLLKVQRHNEIPKLLGASDIFMLPSLSEGISNAALEAMSCGLPVVTTNCGGMTEVITDGVNGFIVPVRKPEALAETLEKLCRDAKLRLDVGKAARERIISGYDIDRQINEFLSLYDHMLGESVTSPDNKSYINTKPDETFDHMKVLENRPLRILSVGKLVWENGYEYALSAIAELKEKGINCQFRIIGKGDFLEAICFARYQLKLENIVELVRTEPLREQIQMHMQWADIFLNSAVSSEFSNGLAEAQAIGCPVVCSDAIQLPRNIKDKKNVLVARRRDPRDIASKLELLSNDRP